MKFKRFGALLVSAVLCIGMAAPAFAFEGDSTPVEQPVLPEIVEEDTVTITDEESGALTPEGRWPGWKNIRRLCRVFNVVWSGKRCA